MPSPAFEDGSETAHTARSCKDTARTAESATARLNRFMVAAPVVGSRDVDIHLNVIQRLLEQQVKKHEAWEVMIIDNFMEMEKRILSRLDALGAILPTEGVEGPTPSSFRRPAGIADEATRDSETAGHGYKASRWTKASQLTAVRGDLDSSNFKSGFNGNRHAARMPTIMPGMIKQTKSEKTEGWLQFFVGHRAFDMFIGVVVLFNSLLVGIQVDNEARGNRNTIFFDVAEYCCSAVFSLELLLRVGASGRRLLSKKNRPWTAFDTVLVVLSWSDFLIRGIINEHASVAKMLKIVRMARTLRMLRMVRFLAPLRVMVATTIGTLMALFWLFVFLAAVIYLFATVLTQGATDLINADLEDLTEDEAVAFYWGSVGESMYTLFMSMCGGVSWGEPGVHVRNMGTAYFFLFVFYIFFAFFSVINIVTGVFVDGAIQQANSDRALLIEKTITAKKVSEAVMTELLEEVDRDASGEITMDEWQAALEDERVWACMKALGINADEDLWFILDRNGDETLTIEEFVSGMTHLKGDASAIDIYNIMCKIDQLASYVYRQLPQVCQFNQAPRPDNHSQARNYGPSIVSTPSMAYKVE